MYCLLKLAYRSKKSHQFIISSYGPNYHWTPNSNQSDASFSHVTYWGNVGWAWFGVETNTSVKSEKIPSPDYTRVDCERPRIYAGIDPELYPRGRLWWLPESTPPSQDLPPFIVIMWSVFGSQNLPLPPRIYPLFKQLYATLPECTPPSQNIPPFQQMYVRPYPPRIYPPPPSPRTYPLFNNYNIMRPSQNLPLPPKIYPPFQSIYVCDNSYMRPSHPSPQNIPVFQQLYATFPESTPPSQNIGLPPFLTNVYVRPSQNPPLPPIIYPLFNNYMRPSQNLPLLSRIYPLFNKCMCDPRRIYPPPRIYPPFQQLHATLPESTPPSQNIPPFQQL